LLFLNLTKESQHLHYRDTLLAPQHPENVSQEVQVLIVDLPAVNDVTGSNSTVYLFDSSAIFKSLAANLICSTGEFWKIPIVSAKIIAGKAIASRKIAQPGLKAFIVILF